jgi:hypothetical protein
MYLMPNKKRILKEFKLTEISAVDKPAQSPALATIMKRHDDDSVIEKKYVMTSGTDGHTHLVSIDMYSKDDMGGYTSWTDNHEHPFILRDDGSIEIGEANGHDHGVFPSTEQIFQKGLTEAQIEPIMVLMKTSFKKPTSADNGGQQPAHTKETNMPDISTAVHQTALDKVDELTKALATASAVSSMSDTQKALYTSLDGADQALFITKSASQREEAVIAKAASNPVVYTALDGTAFHKNDDTRLVNMAKRADDADEALAKAVVLTENATLAKRASSEFGNLPGEQADQVALLKAVSAIEDEATRSNVETILKSHNANLAALTSTFGTQTVAKANGDAGQELDTLAKAHVSANPEVGYLDAYDLVAEANPDLYNRAVAG